MAEVLIRKREHWAELVKPNEWSDLKWNGCPRMGDIVEIRDDGYFRVEALGEGLHGWNRDAFALIRLPNAAYDTVKHMQGPYQEYDGNEVLVKSIRNRYRIVQWASIPWKKNIVTVGGKQFEEWYRDISNIQTVNITDRSLL